MFGVVQQVVWTREWRGMDCVVKGCIVPKGLFCQCVCVLTDGSTTITDVRAALQTGGFHVVRDKAANERWEFGGESLVVAFKPEVNGAVVVDIMTRPWPDQMIDTPDGPFIFGGWAMSQFGPLTFPEGLKRACEQSWIWRDAASVAAKHQGVIRIRMTYAGGIAPDAEIMPRTRDAVAEMSFLTQLVIALGSARGATCYFNPGGEVLRDFDSLKRVHDACSQQWITPFLLWSNVRLYRLNQEYVLMETVGNEQLDIRDVEAVFPLAEYAPADVDIYLRNVTHYLQEQKPQLEDGQTIDGPDDAGQSWAVHLPQDALVMPARRVVRLCPRAHVQVIGEVLDAAKRS
jgi:hypothetical protein